jgi:hypothetical protein
VVWQKLCECDVFIWLISGGLIGLPVVTISRYLWTGWAIKRQDVMNSLNDSARKTYLARFMQREFATFAEASVEFEKEHDLRYGRQHYVLPMAIFLFVIIFSVSCASQTVAHWLNVCSKNIIVLPGTGFAAISGAYMWVVSDLIWRTRRLDLSPSDILWSSLRLVIAAAMGYSFAALVKDEIGPFIAFSLGAFPLAAISTALRKLANQNLKLDLGPTENAGQLMGLEGIDSGIAERLANEDMTTIAQLAYCDPIQLTMRTNLSFNFVVDIVGQALAWIYLGDKMNNLRQLGLRGAYEISVFLDDLDAGVGVEHDAANAVLSSVAAAVELDVDAVRYPLEQIAGDPYTQFLCETWI